MQSINRYVFVSMYSKLNTREPNSIQEIPAYLSPAEPCTLEFISNHFNIHEMCNEAVCIKPYLLEFVPDHLKNRGMYNEVMQMKPAPFFLFPTTSRPKQCELKQFNKTHGGWTISLIIITHKKMYHKAEGEDPYSCNMSLFFLWCKSKREDGIRTLIQTVVNSLFRGVIVMNNARYKKER